MSARRNRVVLALIGLLLLAGGAASACLGLGVFGSSREHRYVFDNTVIRWWNEGGWKSFAVVGAIGAVGVVLGLRLAYGQLRRHQGRSRVPTMVFAPPNGARGETTLRSPALSHGMETDLERIADVRGALVGLFGHYPNIEVQAVLTVGDSIDLDHLPDRVSEVLARVKTTTGVELHPVQVTVRFKDVDRERQLQ